MTAPCGTVGCQLKDNHPGLHLFPQPETKRMKSKATSILRALDTGSPGIPTEAEGFRLELSTTTNSGYKGVFDRGRYKNPKRRFQIASPTHRDEFLSFESAVQAAVARAQLLAEVEAGPSPLVEAGARAPEADPESQKSPTNLVTFAQGLRLHLSPNSNTGYVGVYFRKKAPARNPFVATAPGWRHLGYFATAVEAAVAYAKVAGGGKDHVGKPSSDITSTTASNTLARIEGGAEVEVEVETDREDESEAESEAEDADEEVAEAITAPEEFTSRRLAAAEKVKRKREACDKELASALQASSVHSQF